jgi:hypothetical protein
VRATIIRTGSVCGVAQGLIIRRDAVPIWRFHTEQIMDKEVLQEVLVIRTTRAVIASRDR